MGPCGPQQGSDSTAGGTHEKVLSRGCPSLDARSRLWCRLVTAATDSSRGHGNNGGEKWPDPRTNWTVGQIRCGPEGKEW